MNHWLTADGETAVVGADDRGLHYGDGLFETIAIRNGTARLFDRHLARLKIGCDRLALPFPGDDVASALLQRVLASAENPARGVVKFILTAGGGPRGYARPSACTPTFMGRFAATEPLPPEVYAAGVGADWSPVMASQQPLLAGLKTLNRLEQVLARQAAGDDFEHLLCDADSRIICGTMSNIMLVIDQQLVTPDLSRAGIAGVMRAHLCEQVDDIEIRDVTRDEAAEASEILLCNSQYGLVPVATLGHWQSRGREQFTRLSSQLAASGVIEP